MPNETVTPLLSAADILALTTQARPTDGSGITPNDAGRAGDTLLRLTDPGYGDGISTMGGANSANPRAISNIVMQQTTDIPEPGGASDYLWAWGQFLDHDITLSEPGHTETANIEIPVGDPYFDPMGTGNAELRFSRVDAVDGTGVDTPREYANDITAFIDGSQIYGSTTDVMDMMRVEGGKLRMVDNMLEQQNGGFMTGDIRAAENVALSSLHTLFTREHNRQVDLLQASDPTLTDDELFNGARAHVEGVMQAITYNEFLPRLLGENAIAEYDGYDASANPGISVEFSTAVYRFGHSLLSGTIQRLDENGDTHASGDLALRDAFFNPAAMFESGIDPILRGLGQGESQALDALVVEDVRSFLFGPPGAGGFDLAALNIQRGRDLGVASYNDLREGLGLTRAETFADVTSDADLAARLEAAYGDVDLIDAWVGGLAEDPVNGGLVGETFATVMVDQFTRTRDGDPLWSQNRGLSDEALDEIWFTTLSDVITRNTDVDYMQTDAFAAYERIGGTEGRDYLTGDEGRDLIIGFDGNDRLRGRDGEDELFGGAGRDKLYGGDDDDILHGDEGRDYLRGGDGNDIMFGGRGRDYLSGGDDNDALFGGDGRDYLKGKSGDDYIDGGAGRDRLFGGRGDDDLNGGDAMDHLSGGRGDDRLTGGDGADTFYFRPWKGGHDTVTDYDVEDTVVMHGRWSKADVDGSTVTFTKGYDMSVTFLDLDADEIADLIAQDTGYHCYF